MMIRRYAVLGVFAAFSFASAVSAEPQAAGSDPSLRAIFGQPGTGPASETADEPKANASPKVARRKPKANPSSKTIAGQRNASPPPKAIAAKPQANASSKVTARKSKASPKAMASQATATQSSKLVAGASKVHPASKPLIGTPTANPAAQPAVANANAAMMTKPHRLVIQVNQNDPAVMNLALNNATNVIDYYRAKQQEVQVDLVTYGPGLNMLRDDTSPVKDRIKQLKDYAFPSTVQFSACTNTKENMEKKEGKPIVIVSDAVLVPSGVVRVMELQEQGWSYVRP
jgi:uncharacterized protein